MLLLFVVLLTAYFPVAAQTIDAETTTARPAVKECFSCNSKAHKGCWPFDRELAEAYRENCTAGRTVCRQVWQKEVTKNIESESVYRDCALPNDVNAMRRGRNGVRYETFHCFADLCNAADRIVPWTVVLCLLTYLLRWGR